MSATPVTPSERALEAAGLGTWDWDTTSGRVEWSRRTYQLFGYEPYVIDASHDLFLGRVYADDRPAVVRWCEGALRDRTRTSLEYRIVRIDDEVRWVRSVARAIGEGGGLHLVGVVDDVTEERGRAGRVVQPPATSARSFSARQVARLLDVGESTVKRLAATNALRSLQSSRRDSRRFAPEDVAEYLRTSAGDASSLAMAASVRDMSACLVAVMQHLLSGGALDELLDRELRGSSERLDRDFLDDLLSRMPFAVPDRAPPSFPALIVDRRASSEAALVRCMLRATGHETLSTAGLASGAEIAEVAASVRARIVVLFGDPSLPAPALARAAADVARHARAATVCAWSSAELDAGNDVTRIASVGDLVRVLQRP
jgi:excisionase family DNA binding protein